MKDFFEMIWLLVILLSMIYFSCFQVFRWVIVDGCPPFRTTRGKEPLKDLIVLIGP